MNAIRLFRTCSDLLVLSAILVFAVTGTTGCTLLVDCGRDRQYCAGDECVCGETCNGDEDCDGNELCAFYEGSPTDGVCVASDYAERHQLGEYADSNASTNNSDNGECLFGSECSTGLCCVDVQTCVESVQACSGDLACADGSVSAECQGTCQSHENCASGWRCDPASERCVQGCRSDSDCPGEDTCGPDHRCRCASVSCPSGQVCDPANGDCRDLAEFGQSCATSSQCETGICLAGGASVCTVDCDASTCPADFSCQVHPVATARGTEGQLVCVPSAAQTCAVQSDCGSGEVCALPFEPQPELSCVPPDGGGSEGDSCFSDSSCQNLLCIDDRCATLCQSRDDCGNGESCVSADVTRDDANVSVSICQSACTAPGDPCDPSAPPGPDFTCSDEGVCTMTCQVPFTASGCPSGHYCWEQDSENVCLPSVCDSNTDCDFGDTCVAFDNDFSFCIPGGDLPEGAPCDPDTNACISGTHCRATEAGPGRCSRFCEPWSQDPGCPPDQFCAQPFTTRTFLCMDNTTTSGTEPYDTCTASPDACGHATLCFATNESDKCLAYCRPGANDCTPVPDGRNSVCDPYRFPRTEALGLCVEECDPDSPLACGDSSATCVDGFCRRPCVPGAEVELCCDGNEECDFICDPMTNLCR